MTFCAHCGNGLPQLAAFCDRCGAPVTPPTTAPVEGGLTAGVDLAGLSPQEQVRLAGDPRTPPQLLRDLAAHCPGVRMLIATNPATYPDLLVWLAGLLAFIVQVLRKRARGGWRWWLVAPVGGLLGSPGTARRSGMAWKAR